MRLERQSREIKSDPEMLEEATSSQCFTYVLSLGCV